MSLLVAPLLKCSSNSVSLTESVSSNTLNTHNFIPMLRIGLTGGIGSGKSTVAKIFELLGIPVYYADAVSKNLYNTDPELMASIKKHFGEDLYEEGMINKSKLAALVFSAPQKLELLNQLVHPPTIRAAEAWMMKQSTAYAIKEAALIFESGSASGLDYVIGVQAPLSLRVKRVMDRDHVSREDVYSRINRQMDENIKMKLCDFIIINDEQHMLIPQVLELHAKLIGLAERKNN